MGDDRHDPRGAGGHKEAPVTNTLRWDANQNVTGDAASETDDHGQHHDTEGVEPRPDGGQPATESEDEGSTQVQDEQQHGVEAPEGGRHDRRALRSGRGSTW